MKRRIVPLLCVIVTATLFLSCTLSTDDEIRLISPKDGAVLNVNNLRADTTFEQDGIHISSIHYVAPFRWEVAGMVDQEYYTLEFSTRPKYKDTVRFNVLFSEEVSPEETVHEVTIVLAHADGHVDEDGYFIPDTIIIYNSFYYWRVSAYLEDSIGVYSETWSFTVVKD